jgi:Ni,Fe-hydrogenase I cytochrome b subunit
MGMDQLDQLDQQEQLVVHVNPHNTKVIVIHNVQQMRMYVLMVINLHNGAVMLTPSLVIIIQMLNVKAHADKVHVIKVFIITLLIIKRFWYY